MTYTKHDIRPGAYFDSVILMQLQKSLVGLPGIEDAGVVMATPANRDVLTSTGFSLEDIEAESDDLLILVKGESETAVSDAIAQVDSLLKKRQTGGAGDYRPKSLTTAVNSVPNANWVLISVPGRFAADLAHQALDKEKHVFLYSDNVSVEQEIELKQKGRELGRIVMGPDCGTAIINGIGFGFANRVRQGKIGIVAASGTGLQAVTVDIHNLGGGISQAFGTGGRDLKEAVGGIAMLQGLTLLQSDPQTEVIVLISKPPATAVAARLLGAARASQKPTIINFIGYAPPARQIENLFFSINLHETAKLAFQFSQSAQDSMPFSSPQSQNSGYLRGLFSGGTLASETLFGLRPFLTPLYSNIGDPKMADLWQSEGHTLVDMGEDEFTQGRLHPMMDNDLRLRRLQQEADDPDTGYLLLDVVLGDGAHLDPASEVAPAIAAVKTKRPDIKVGVIVIGTEDDPQDINEQIKQLSDSGAAIFRSPSEAITALSAAFYRSRDEKWPILPIKHFEESLAAINVGVESFYNSLKAQGAAAVQMDWRPPAGGNEKMLALLAKMKSKS